MKKPFFIRLAVLLLLFVALMATGLADSDGFPPNPITAPEPFTAYPPRNKEGYLDSEQYGKKEFVHIDLDKEEWIYLSPTLQVEINKYESIYKKKPIVWFESIIKSKKESFSSFIADPEKPSKKLMYPEDIAKDNQVIYAQNGDFFVYRLEKKKRPGLILRNGILLHHNTNSKIAKSLPSLDELVIYKDRFEVNYPGIYSPEDYMAKGATDVFAFGPLMIKDGEIDDRLLNAYTAREPRSVIGMIAPGHYMGFYMESRNDRSYGTGLEFIARRMKDQGCQLAINLDGGNSGAMIFMGETIMKGASYNGWTRTRPQQDIIGIGKSALIEPKESTKEK